MAKEGQMKTNTTPTASPKLKRRGDRFRRALDERQKRNFAKILSHPKSKAYHDYVEIPAGFGVKA